MKQIDLLEKVIKNAVKEAVREEMTDIRKQLSEVRKLTAKIIKEGVQTGTTKSSPYNTLTNRGIQETVKESYSMPDIPEDVLHELSRAGKAYANTDDLPDVDIPANLFLDPNNRMFKDMKNAIS